MSLKNIKVWQIVLHLIVWSIFYGFMIYPFVSQYRPVPADFQIRFLLIFPLFYLNYFYLVPNLLLKKNTVIYITVSVFIIISIILFIDFGFKPPSVEGGMRPPKRPANGYFRREFFLNTMTIGFPWVVSTLLRLYMEWRKNENLRVLVENEKVNSELQFLKTQLNPHFFFNSLNAIYALSKKKSPDTSEAIVSLSELMRYMLYETNKDFVPIKKEIEYIQSYVQLQRLRLSDSENVTLKISGAEKGKMIPPLLFISFIENAFKYGTDYKGKTSVGINLSLLDESIHLKVTNKIGAFRKQLESSGVGFQNIKNRLNLLYPNSHELNVDNNGETYIVDLTLNLL